MSLTLLGLQSRVGDKPLKVSVVCPQNGTAVLKGSKGSDSTEELPDKAIKHEGMPSYR